MEVALVHIANSLTGMAEQGLDVDVEMVIQPVDPGAWETTGLAPDSVDEIFALAGEQFTEALELVLPRSFPSL